MKNAGPPETGAYQYFTKPATGRELTTAKKVIANQPGDCRKAGKLLPLAVYSHANCQSLILIAHKANVNNKMSSFPRTVRRFSGAAGCLRRQA